MNSKKNTLKNYEFIFTRFQEVFHDRQIESITTDEVLSIFDRFLATRVEFFPLVDFALSALSLGDWNGSGHS
jgi:hypothetical protein